MEYTELAKIFMKEMQTAQKAGRETHLNEGLHGELFVLFFLHQKSQCKEITPSDISSAIGLSTARIAATLKSLEGKGFVVREIDQRDRRKILVQITEEGSAYCKDRINNKVQFISQLFAKIGEEDARQYVRITGRLVEALLRI